MFALQSAMGKDTGMHSILILWAVFGGPNDGYVDGDQWVLLQADNGACVAYQTYSAGDAIEATADNAKHGTDCNSLLGDIIDAY